MTAGSEFLDEVNSTDDGGLGGFDSGWLCALADARGSVGVRFWDWVRSAITDLANLARERYPWRGVTGRAVKLAAQNLLLPIAIAMYPGSPSMKVTLCDDGVSANIPARFKAWASRLIPITSLGEKSPTSSREIPKLASPNLLSIDTSQPASSIASLSCSKKFKLSLSLGSSVTLFRWPFASSSLRTRADLCSGSRDLATFFSSPILAVRSCSARRLSSAMVLSFRCPSSRSALDASMDKIISPAIPSETNNPPMMSSKRIQPGVRQNAMNLGPYSKTTPSTTIAAHKCAANSNRPILRSSAFFGIAALLTEAEALRIRRSRRRRLRRLILSVAALSVALFMLWFRR